MNPLGKCHNRQAVIAERQRTRTQVGEGRLSANPREAVSALLEGIRELVLERQQLRDRGASGDELEKNRQAIVEAPWRLARAAIEAHALPEQAKAA
jgi:hypothetical protein